MSSEEAVQQAVRLDVAKHGLTPMRNNVGAMQDATGRVVRFGLMNDSKALNERFKSSDLIIPRSVVVTQEMVGCTIAVFAAVECKASDWVFRASDKRAEAQQRFIDLVLAAGGMAGFATSIGEARQILRLG